MKDWLKRNFTISSGLPKNIYELQRQTKDVIGIVERTLKAKESTYNKLLNKLKTTDGRAWEDLTKTEQRYFNSILNQMLKGKLDYINPDFVHVLMNGKIAKSGCMELAEELEKVGYEKL